MRITLHESAPQSSVLLFERDPLTTRGLALLGLGLASLLAALLVDGGSLLNTGIMALELDSGVLWEVEHVLHDFASPQSARGTTPESEEKELTES